MCYHNFLCRSDLDDENLRDADNLRPSIEEAGISLILHGHKHIAGVEQIRNPVKGHMLTMVGAGSSGLDGSELPDNANQYTLLVFDSKKDIQLILRQFSTQTIGLHGPGTWVADTSVSENGLLRIRLTDPQPAPLADGVLAPTKNNLVGRHAQIEQLATISF